jgi:tetratricopeptide (TPR) repeat protein
VAATISKKWRCSSGARPPRAPRNWELAITQFQKFLKERDKTRDKFSQGAFYINMAICHYKLGRIPEGNENLEIAIKNKERFPTPDAAIVAGFQALVTGAIEKRNEQALLDFIAKNRGELIIEPYAMHQYSRLFMKLAGDAVSAGYGTRRHGPLSVRARHRGRHR